MEQSTEGVTYGLPLPFFPLVKSRVIGAFTSPATGRPSQRVPAFGRGRICAMPGCNTVLSTYNPELSCSLHVGLGIPPRRL
jgi:hypothetical protein